MDETKAIKLGTEVKIPRRAWKLLARILQVERDCNGRGQLTIDIIMVNGEWLIGELKRGPLELLTD